MFADSLTFDAGNFNCIHIASRGNTSFVEQTIDQIRRIGDEKLLTSGVCNLAMQRTGLREWLFPESPYQWVARQSGISVEEAGAIIDSFGCHPSSMDRPVRDHAISTRIILGLSVLVATNPDVLIYKNEGMDPVFARNIHEYLATHVTNSVFVFVQLNSSVLDEEICFDACPDSAICTLVDRGV